MLRLAFAGTPEFAVPTLRALAASGHTLVGVLTQPDRPAGRGRVLSASPVKLAAQELGLPVAQPAKLKSEEERAALAEWQPDALIVVAYGLILPAAVLALPRLGCINVHASLLPRWRGAAPIQRAILAGDTESGVTIMQMDVGLDTGPMWSRCVVPIDITTTGEQLHDALAAAGAALLVETLSAIEHRTRDPEPQPAEGTSYASKLDKAEARIDWSADAAQIARQVRAFNPWPVAETRWQGQQLRIWDARALLSEGVGSAGQLLSMDTDGALRIRCGEGVLAVTKLQLAGRRAMSAREFAAGAAWQGTSVE